MKHTKCVGGIITLVAVAAGASLAPGVRDGRVLAGIEGSKHDFSAATGDACSGCHTPHRDEAPPAAPIWNPDADLSRRFGTAGVTGRRAALGTGTMGCLRCHDGTVARAITGFNARRYKLRPMLARRGHGATSHPVGVDYPQFGKGFRPMTSVLSRGTVLLPDGKVECTSCHDPHNAAGIGKMLVTSNARSALCRTCHRK